MPRAIVNALQSKSFQSVQQPATMSQVNGGIWSHNVAESEVAARLAACDALRQIDGARSIWKPEAVNLQYVEGSLGYAPQTREEIERVLVRGAPGRSKGVPGSISGLKTRKNGPKILIFTPFLLHLFRTGPGAPFKGPRSRGASGGRWRSR